MKNRGTSQEVISTVHVRNNGGINLGIVIGREKSGQDGKVFRK